MLLISESLQNPSEVIMLPGKSGSLCGVLSPLNKIILRMESKIKENLIIIYKEKPLCVKL